MAFRVSTPANPALQATARSAAAPERQHVSRSCAGVTRRSSAAAQRGDDQKGATMRTLSPEAVALTNVLLEHHARVCRRPGGPPRDVDSCLIVYGSLCDRAGLPYLTRSVGNFLQEVAEWCSDNDWPPLNSLAVNQDSRMPGECYDLAPGCSLLNWPDQLKACIAFRSYPSAV